MDIETFHHLGAVGLDRFDAELEAPSDVTGRIPQRDEAQHLDLARAQRPEWPSQREGCLDRRGQAAQVALQHEVGDPRSDERHDGCFIERAHDHNKRRRGPHGLEQLQGGVCPGRRTGVVREDDVGTELLEGPSEGLSGLHPLGNDRGPRPIELLLQALCVRDTVFEQEQPETAFTLGAGYVARPYFLVAGQTVLRYLIWTLILFNIYFAMLCWSMDPQTASGGIRGAATRADSRRDAGRYIGKGFLAGDRRLVS